MTMTLWRSILLGVVLALGIIPTSAQRPDPHRDGPGRPMATAEASPEEVGCDLVQPYTRDLFTAIDDSGAFADYFYADADFGDVSASEAREIVRDGDALIVDLQHLDVPPSYSQGHKGIIVFLQFQIDTARFYGLDTSVVPDIAAQDRAFVDIEAGEVAIAEACPDEVKRVGGYILLDPEDAPSEPVNPDSMPG